MNRNAPSPGGLYAAGASSLCLIALSSCAALPPADHTARLAKLPGSYETTQSLKAQASAWPADGWWKRYGDSGLDSLMADALAGSPSLAQARARLEKARSMVTVTAASGLPTLSAAAQAQGVKQSYEYLFPKAFLPLGYQDYGQATLNLNWELDFWGRNRAAVAAAASDVRAKAADAAEARLILTTDIAAQYATLARLQADRAVALESAKVREETATLALQRVNNGLDTQAELQQAQAGPPAARAAVAALDEEIAQTRDALAALAGAGPDRTSDLNAASGAPIAAFGLPADLPLRLVGRRPDVVAARWRAEAATHRVAEARRAFYPDINLSGYFGQQALHLDKLVEPGAAIGAFGSAVSLPIFDGGRLRGELRGARADSDEAVAAYDGAVAEALREVADVVASERALGDRLSESRQALKHYEAAYKVARLRYEGGLATFQSVLLAEDAVLAQRQIVSDLDSRAFTLDVALVRALGGGFDQTQEGPDA